MFYSFIVGSIILIFELSCFFDFKLGKGDDSSNEEGFPSELLLLLKDLD